jgi:hypothetical protein
MEKQSELLKETVRFFRMISSALLRVNGGVNLYPRGGVKVSQLSGDQRVEAV